MTNWLTVIPQDTETVAGYVEAVRTLSGVGKEGYHAVSKVFGPIFYDHLKKIFRRAEEMKASIPEERHTKQSPAIVIPLLDAAMKESRPELQELWAALLANAQLDGSVKVRREYIDAVARFEPLDAAVLQIIAGVTMPGRWDDQIARNSNEDYLTSKRQEKSISEDDWEVSCAALQRLGCIIPNKGPLMEPSFRFPDTTAFARKLLQAVEVK